MQSKHTNNKPTQVECAKCGNNLEIFISTPCDKLIGELSQIEKSADTRVYLIMSPKKSSFDLFGDNTKHEIQLRISDGNKIPQRAAAFCNFTNAGKYLCFKARTTDSSPANLYISADGVIIYDLAIPGKKITYAFLKNLSPAIDFAKSLYGNENYVGNLDVLLKLNQVKDFQWSLADNLIDDPKIIYEDIITCKTQLKSPANLDGDKFFEKCKIAIERNSNDQI